MSTANGSPALEDGQQATQQGSPLSLGGPSDPFLERLCNAVAGRSESRDGSESDGRGESTDTETSKTYLCGHCDREIGSKGGFTVHYRAVHHPELGRESDNTFPCAICGEREFDSQHGLKVHQGRIHSFGCPDCEREFETERGRNIHVGHMHSSPSEESSSSENGGDPVPDGGVTRAATDSQSAATSSPVRPESPSGTVNSSKERTRRLPDGALYGGMLSKTEQEDAGEDRSCPECSSATRENTSNETVCVECGLILDEYQIDHGPEWRAYTHQARQEKKRVGRPETKTRHDDGLTTEIDSSNRDAFGRSLSREQRKRAYRLRKKQKWVQAKDASERNLMTALGEIKRLASCLDLSQDVREVASVIYRRALKEDLIRGRSIEGMTAASVWAAVRQQGVPRQLDKVVGYSRTDEKEIQRAFSYLSRELELTLEPMMPMEYVPQFASALDVDNETERKAKELLEDGIEANVHSGKSPSGLAAAAVYGADLLLHEEPNLYQTEVAEITEFCDVTIRKRYRELLSAHGVDPDSEEVDPTHN